MTLTTPLPPDIALIDTLHLGRPSVVASYLLLGDEPALVDPGPASALPGLEAGLAASGLRVEDLSALLLTHIHLDHAGAAGTLVRRNPRLRVYVHQRGAPHMIDPEKLLRSAARLYGDQMEYLWGEFLPTPAENVTALAGGESLSISGRAIDVYDAPGHASHHLLYHRPSDGLLWTGDDAGVRMPGHRYARPATPPPDIDLEAWERTWQQIEALAPSALLLTHFGAYDDPLRHIAELREHTARWSEAVRAGLESGAPEPEQVAMLEALAAAELDSGGEEAQRLYGEAASVVQCWQGLARYWRKR
jgi:glyoxylase-like metal-dependent hydrolase (beta-lactamase superfamily II)